MKNVGIYLFNKVELLDFAGPYEVFSTTAELNDHKPFKVFTISEDGGAIKSVNGLIVIPDYSFSNHPKIDILIIPGGEGTKEDKEEKGHGMDRKDICVGRCNGHSLFGGEDPGCTWAP